MSVQAEGRGLIHKGDRTTTGGVVTSGVGNVMYVGEGVTQIKMIATCPACKKGQGEIIPLETIAVFVDNIQAALHGDIVACDCSWGSNTLIASAGAMKFSQSNGQVYGFKPHASPQEMEATYQSVASSMGGRYLNAGTTVVEKRKLDNEVLKATEELLIFLPALNLETSVHSQAIKEFSQAFDVILKGYNGENISYETGYDLIHQIKNGFIDGGGTLKKLEENRLSRRTETVGNFSHGGSYRRNLVVNNESFNVRFKASCATPECLMRNAHIDMEDDAFQDYIEAATQDKRSDVMQTIGVALIANPYLAPLQRTVLADVAYSGVFEGNFDPAWAYAMGMGTAYRLRLLNLPKRVQDTSESVVSYFSGNFLSGDNDDD